MIQTTAALAAAVLTYVLVTLPAARVHIDTPLAATAVVGAYHIHTERSDGAGTPGDVAAAAAKAGLRFAILTDHGDATRAPDPPRYVSGVLLIDAVEVSAVEGHIVALGLAGPAPYRLGGEARDVIEDIHRLGGAAIVAHPDSSRQDLRWRGQGGPAGQGGPGRNEDLSGADGLEWLNADSEWRDRGWPQVLDIALHMPFRPGESFAQLLNRPAASLRRWDALARRRSIIGLAAVDAHGAVAGLNATTFKSFAQGVILDTPLSGDAPADAARVLTALRSGRAFSVVTGIADPALPQLTAKDDSREVSIGGRLTSPMGRVRVAATIPDAGGARVVIMHNDRSVAEGLGRAEVAGEPEPGAYRLEVWLGSNRIPWIVTNPVYVDPPAAAQVSTPDANRRGAPEIPGAPIAVPLVSGPQWAVEHGPSSSGTAGGSAGAVDFQWTIGTEQPGLEYAALARSMGDGQASFDRIEFTASAAAPMRLSVQFRLPGGRDGERWGRSIYLDETPRSITVRLVDVTPQGFSATSRPVVARIKSILFVVDTLHTAPGTRGVVHLSDIRLVRTADPAASGANGQQPVERAGQEQQVRRPGRQGGRQ